MSQTVIQHHAGTEIDTGYDVELRKVFKVYKGETAVRGIDLNIGQGEFFSILGPSGCGKTTTLRLIAGFEELTAGEILIRGRSMINVPPYRRPVNTVFQSYALFGHMTVWDNVAFGLRIKGLSKSEIQERVGKALHLVKMETYARRFPSQLSGGQQQRVALARALINRPTVVLLDEPLGALDLKLRKEMQMELSNLHRELGVTFVMVTHDQEEALSLSDRIAVMHEGRIEQVGTPNQIYESPQTPFVADFIGDTNLFEGEVVGFDRMLLQIITPKGLQILAKPLPSGNNSDLRQVVASIRPEKIKLSLDQPPTHVNCFEGRLKTVMYLGTHVHCLVELASGDQVTVMQPNQLESIPDAHASIYICWSATDCLTLAASEAQSSL